MSYWIRSPRGRHIFVEDIRKPFFSKDGSLRPAFSIKWAVFPKLSNVCTYILQNNLCNFWNFQKNFNSEHTQMVTYVFLQFKYNESRYKQCGVTPNFSTGQNLRVVSRIRGAFRTLSNIYDVAFLQKYLRAFSHSEKLKKYSVIGIWS